VSDSYMLGNLVVTVKI